MRAYGSKIFAATLWGIFLSASAGHSGTLRIICYNIDCFGESSENNITGPTHSIPTVIQAIGLHHLGTNAQPVDVIGLEELLTTTAPLLVNQLNAIYGAGTYASDPTKDKSTGGGSDGLVYNTHTIQVISARVLPIGQTVLLQPDGTYLAANSPGGGTNGVTRGPLAYQLRPIGYGTTEDFYLYVDHARSSSDDSMGDARYAEAQELRSDAKYNLPAGAHIIYSGDWNLFSGSNENAYKCLTGQVTSDGIDWSDNSAIWTNANPTQAYDPVSKTTPPTVAIWRNVTADHANYIYSWSTASLGSRLDVQLVNAPVLYAYNQRGGVQLANDSADPYDSLNFPSSQYPFAYEVFGNNGSATHGSNVASTTNHALDDLLNSAPNEATVYADLKVNDNGESSTGSDHFPVVADYLIVPTPVSLTALALGTNGFFQVRLSATPNTAFRLQASSNLTSWTDINSGFTDANGLLLFQDTNPGTARFYRAFWPVQ